MCTHNIKISGNLSQVKAARRFLKKNGFMDRCIDRGFPLNGRWQTDHGLHVIVERKLVRWSSKRASRLIFRSADRSFCELSLYGETVQGQVVPEVGPGFPKTLKWSNGDTWQLLDGSCCAGEDMMFSQSMSKISRDATHDERIRLDAETSLGLTSRVGLPVPADCLRHVLQYIGSTSCCIQVKFQTKPSFCQRGAAALLGMSNWQSQCRFEHDWGHMPHGVSTPL
jgi:hypothetical protein